MKKSTTTASVILIISIFSVICMMCSNNSTVQEANAYVDSTLRDTSSKIPENDSIWAPSDTASLVWANNGTVTSSPVWVAGSPADTILRMARAMRGIYQLDRQWTIAKDRLYQQILVNEDDTTQINKYWDNMDASYDRFHNAIKDFESDYKNYLK
jgi:hypothetical protein